MPENGSPLIIFDGVCPLCNGSIGWILQQDRRSVFRFAALQSNAARAALAAANALPALPDSMALIDADGVHTRSDAVLRIAGRLGFPWSLAGIARLLPRRLRDWAYDRLARNRYRWFGRRDTCLAPAPEIRARFLDADEPRAIVPDATPAPEASVPQRAPVLRTFALRWFLVYLFLHIFPFPLGIIPYTSWPAELWEKLNYKIVPWVGKQLFGLNITIFPGGSGDTTYNYVELFFFAMAALAIAAGWTVARRARPISPRTIEAMQILVRYSLATIMLNYGWHKIMPLQFPAPGPDRLLETYGDSSPMGLLWTFMGASKHYVMFSGLMEASGGFLLFFRRTALLGAMVSAAVMTNVVLMNFCYDVPVKLFSSRLLLMALFVIAPHAARLFNLFFLNLPVPPAPQRAFSFDRLWVARSVGLARIAFIAYMTLMPAWTNYQMWTSIEPKKSQAGYYRVESFARDEATDHNVPDSYRWVRVGVSSMGLGVVLVADGSGRRQRMEFDDAKGTLTITRRGEPKPITLQFKQVEPGLVTVEGNYDGGRISARLRRQEDSPPLLVSRGFHWINEFPYNR